MKDFGMQQAVWNIIPRPKLTKGAQLSSKQILIHCYVLQRKEHYQNLSTRANWFFAPSTSIFYFWHFNSSLWLSRNSYIVVMFFFIYHPILCVNYYVTKWRGKDNELLTWSFWALASSNFQAKDCQNKQQFFKSHLICFYLLCH